MTNNPTTILGINPGTRYLAVSVFRGPELREWCIKTFKGRWSDDKLKKIMVAVGSLITWYQADVLAIKRLHTSRSSESLDFLVKSIKDEVNRQGLKIYEYTLEQIEAPFAGTGKTNKKKMATRIAMKYPVLWGEFEKEKNHKNPYYIRLFEAVALGSVCHDALDRTWPGDKH